MRPEAARRAALLACGGVEKYREGVRDVRTVRWIAGAMQGLRHAVRTLCRSPGFTPVGVGTLAPEIGATVVIFGVVRTAGNPLPVVLADQGDGVDECG